MRFLLGFSKIQSIEENRVSSLSAAYYEGSHQVPFAFRHRRYLALDVISVQEVDEHLQSSNLTDG